LVLTTLAVAAAALGRIQLLLVLEATAAVEQAQKVTQQRLRQELQTRAVEVEVAQTKHQHQALAHLAVLVL
jgi:hypothetical protein